jgi:arylsulfatase A-like enzyme
VGANGHPLLRTPHLDRLAAEGTNFTCAFTPTAICSPARASLLTGQWPTQHGCLSIPGPEIYRPAHQGLPTFSQELARAGYLLGYVGKYHLELTGTPLDYGWESYTPLHEYRWWRKMQGLTARPRKNVWFGELDPYATPEQSELAWGAGKALELVDRYRQAGKPWVVRWDPVEPHLPNIVPEPYFSLYPPATIPPWPSYGDTLAGKPYIQAQQRRSWKLADWTWEEHWAPMVSRYLGEISLLDHQVGRLLQALDAWGLAEHTLVVYSTDHGDLCGGHNMIDKHFVMYDDVMRVPLLARLPGRLPAGSQCDAFVIHELDLATTFCQAAGVPVPATFQGRDLFAVANGQDPAPRPDVYGMWHGGQFGSYTQRMVRDRRWKYVWNLTAEDELYDLQADPGEKTNRATDPACAGELQRLRHRTIAWMEEVKDPMLNWWTRQQLAEGLKV